MMAATTVKKVAFSLVDSLLIDFSSFSFVFRGGTVLVQCLVSSNAVTAYKMYLHTAFGAKGQCEFRRQLRQLW